MEGRRILTFLRPDVLADAYYEDNTLTELSLIPRGKESLLGNIYVGRVKNIAKNIRAAFVEVEGGMICYLPLEDVQEPVWACMKKGEQLAEGDLLLVQVSREAVKSKAPSVTTHLNLSGKYLVLTTGNRRMGYSSRFSAEEKERLKALTGQWAEDDAGWIVRTNAAKACSEELEMEHRRLLSQYEYLRTRAVHRLACSCVWKSRPPYLDTILGSRENILQEILTDDTDLYAQIRQFMEEEMPEDLEKLRLYEDLSDGIIDKAEYFEFRNSYSKIIEDKQEALLRVRKEMKQTVTTGTTERNWVTLFKQYENIEELNRRVLMSLVDRILIYENHVIEIVFKYKDEYQQTLEYVLSYSDELAIAV